ncbi:MAG: glycogen/starch synthase, partial [Candidatus Margulisiibacteriota bacterium]
DTTAEKKLGRIKINTSFGQDYVNVYANDQKEPVIFCLANSNYLNREFLYPHAGESQEAILKRLVFFNKAALILLKELDVNPKILHFIDWPTALGLAYAKRSPEANFPFAKLLFTYPDARYQGLFPNDLRNLTELNENSMDYYDKISLAKLGLFFADLVVTGSYEHICEVINNQRREGGDFGEFSSIFRQLSNQGKLNYLFHSNESLSRLKDLSSADPSPTDKDGLLNLASIYQVRYDHLIPTIESKDINQQLLIKAVAEGNEIDFDLLAKFQRILQHSIFSPEEKTLIKRICHDFGSTALIRHLSEQLHLIEKAKREKNSQEAERIKTTIKELLSQLTSLKIEWGLF